MRNARAEAQANASRLKLALEGAEAGAYEIDHVAKTFWASPNSNGLTGQKDATYAEATELGSPASTPTTSTTYAPRSAPCTPARSARATPSRRASCGRTAKRAGSVSPTT